MGFLLDPTDHHQRFAKIGLGVARGVMQRDKHLRPTALMFAHVILDEYPLGRVALLAVLANVIAQPLVDDPGEPVQLRPLDQRRPPIPGGTEKRTIFFTLSRDSPK